MAITTYAVLLADTLGDPALRAAGERGAATLIGIAITLVIFLLWPSQDGADPGWDRFLSWARGRRWR
jgi:hypothetical protein